MFSLFAILYYYFATFKYAFCFPKHFSSTLTYPSDVEEYWSQLSVFMCYDKIPSSDRARESVVRSVRAPCVLNPCL